MDSKVVKVMDEIRNSIYVSEGMNNDVNEWNALHQWRNVKLIRTNALKIARQQQQIHSESLKGHFIYVTPKQY